MKQDIYKNVMNKIKASDKAKAEAKSLFDTVNSKKNNNLISIENTGIENKKSKRKIPVAVVIAASLAIILALSAIVNIKNISLTEDDSSFIFSVGAEEISNNPLVVPDDITARGLSNNSYSISFPITCKGKNIESITYSIQNAVFVNNSDKIIDSTLYEKKINISNENYLEKGLNYPDNVYSSYTVKYSNQNDPEEYCPSISGSTEMLIENGNIINAVIIKQLTELAFDENIDDNTSTILEKQIMDLYFKDVVLTATVNFTDGTSKSKNIKVGFEIDNFGHRSDNCLWVYITYTLE